MIAANGVTARYLNARKYPSLRRIVRSPKRWDRIVEVAARYGHASAGSRPRALGQFLAGRKAADPLRFPDLSLTIIKLLGAGEYVAEFPGETAPGHFGLAVKDYTHSTAPNRRYPDLITQRLLKAAITGSPMPYARDELTELGRHCTEKEDDANKVERLVGKSAAAMLLAPRTGERFEAIVTGASGKGTWVRLLHPPVEGRLIHGFEGADVGDRLRVQLVRTDMSRGTSISSGSIEVTPSTGIGRPATPASVGENGWPTNGKSPSSRPGASLRFSSWRRPRWFSSWM